MINEALNILVADDSRAVRQFMKVALENRGHSVVCVNDGSQAVDIFALQCFDLVFIDLLMPVLDGHEATLRIKELSKKAQRWVPVIVISGVSDQEVIVKGLSTGADDFLHKPFHIDILYAKLEACTRTILFYKKLAVSEATANAISEGLLDAVISIDASRTILSVNSATQTLFGYERAELLGQNINMLMPEPYHSSHDSYVSNYLETGERKIIGLVGRDVIGLKKNGDTFPLRLGVSEVILDGKQIFIGIISDVTDIKNKEGELRLAAEKLQALHEEMRFDMDMANQVMDKLIFKAALDDDPQIQYHLQPTLQFSGDLIVAMRAQSGQLYVMLADATGHGLAAAVSVLPALWVFRGMVMKDCTVSEIAAEINHRLKETVPAGRFVAALIMSINNAAQTVRLWSGGMPSAWLINDHDGSALEFPSRHLPLGILGNDEFDACCELIEWKSDSQFLMFSDGLCEARNPDGEMLGDEKVKAIITGQFKDILLEKLLHLLNDHLNTESTLDDISIVNILLRR